MRDLYQQRGGESRMNPSDVCEVSELMQDVGFRAFWQELVAKFEPGSEKNPSKNQYEDLEMNLSREKQNYLCNHALLTEIISFSDDCRLSQSQQQPSGLSSAVELGLETALAVQSLDLTGISGEHSDHHAFHSTQSRSSKKRKGTEHEMNSLPSSSSWGGSLSRALGLSKRDIVDSSSKENLKIGQDLALCISTQAEKRAQEIYHWCREDGLEGSSLSLEERNSCCLEYIKSKHDSSQQAHCTIRQLENDLHEDLKKCHGLRMEIFNILKSIIDFATVDSVEHDKGRIAHFKGNMELQFKALRLALEANLYTPEVIKALHIMQHEVHNEMESTMKKLTQIEAELSERKGLGSQYLRISNEYRKLRALISETSLSLESYKQIEDDLDQAID